MDRTALLSAIQGIDTGKGSAEALSDGELLQGLYPVPGQARAFNLDKILVVGGRGTGKTQMFRALLHKEGREAIVKATGVRLIHDVRQMLMVDAFSAGKAAHPDHPPHPATDAIDEIASKGDLRLARRLWLGVCMARLALNDEAVALLPERERTILHPLREAATSPRRLLAWVDEDVERPFDVLDQLDRNAASQRLACVFTFDALDRASDAWPVLAKLVGGLLSLALDTSRRCHAVRLKIFLRPDLESDAARSFPDASKLRGYREELVWDRSDLYRLAFKRMAAHPTEGEHMLRFLKDITGRGCWDRIEPLGWMPTQALNEQRQASVMTRLAGQFMGATPTKGRTYEWIPNHLADAFRRVSPRSFIVAFKVAADWMLERPAPPSEERILTPASLQEGVKEASDRRVEELGEDFPWIHEVKTHLEGLLVPCDAEDALERLARCRFDESRKGLRSEEPRNVLDQLLDLGVFLRAADGRYNSPDLYRLAMKMKRKGGIRPAK
ncbi:hypothetical protein WME91_24210 [Sorangium sp. So ce269]